MIFSDSLKKNSDFKYVYDNGASKADRYLVMYVLQNHTDSNRLGISVSKKVGNSVVRHHITRLVRESYRLSEASFRRGRDIVVIARKSAGEIDYHQVEKSLIHLAKAHGIYQIG